MAGCGSDHDGGLPVKAKKFLEEHRVIMLYGLVKDELCKAVISQFIHFGSSEELITLLIDSLGGDIYSGLGIIDLISAKNVRTVCMGKAMSIGAMFLLLGKEGNRYALPSSRIMLHQPLGQAQGQATDLEIHVAETNFLKDYLYRKISARTGKDLQKIKNDFNRDKFMSAEEAKDYGLIDHILTDINSLFKK